MKATPEIRRLAKEYERAKERETRAFETWLARPESHGRFSTTPKGEQLVCVASEAARRLSDAVAKWLGTKG